MTTSRVAETVAPYTKPGPQTDGSRTPRGMQLRLQRPEDAGTEGEGRSGLSPPPSRLLRAPRTGWTSWKGQDKGGGVALLGDTEQSRGRRVTARELPSVTKLPHDVPMVTRVQRLPSPWQQP